MNWIWCSERREFATAAGECQLCHPECKVQEGKQTCTGPVGPVPLHCCYLQAILPQPLTVCLSVLGVSREQMSVKLVPDSRMGRIVCPPVLRAWWEARRSSSNTPTSRVTVNPVMLTALRGQQTQLQGLSVWSGASSVFLRSNADLWLVSGATVQGLEAVWRHLATFHRKCPSSSVYIRLFQSIHKFIIR